MTADLPENRKLKVAVLMGGTSSERPVSLATGKMILASLNPDKYEATGMDIPDLFALTPGSPNRPDVVFIALHGKGGEDGTVQGMLEILGLPYTGSGVLASALCMNKAKTKQLLRNLGVPCISGEVVERGKFDFDELQKTLALHHKGYRFFVKPNSEGSTFGCSLVETPDALRAAIETAFQYDDQILIERYMAGQEITVGILEDANGDSEVLPIVEIVPKSKFYDYESKYAHGGSDHIIPARLPNDIAEKVRRLAKRSHEFLGCRGMSRTDIIVIHDEMYVLEVNTIPGMTPTSLMPDAAAHAGIPFAELLDRIIASALRQK